MENGAVCEEMRKNEIQGYFLMTHVSEGEKNMDQLFFFIENVNSSSLLQFMIIYSF